MAKLFPTTRIALVGGGLANALIAWRLAQTRPDVTVTLLERGPALGGEHTWSFHESDLPRATLSWLKPFIVHRWPGQEVLFPGRGRRFTTPYASITSQRLHEVVSSIPGLDIRLDWPVRRIAPGEIEGMDGEKLAVDAVIDGRGAVPRQALELGWQKFLGLEVRTRRPHGVALPVIMDATVPQSDGYRFVYLLPFGPDRILIEDTHYADGPGFDASAYRAEIEAYAAGRGWEIAEILRTEQGALPIALGGDVGKLFEAEPLIARSGLSAGLFHPTTGYSLPDAARLASRIADEPDLSAANLARLTRERSQMLWRRRRIYRVLNRMLFRGAGTDERAQILAHFYRLPQPLVERFYADRLTLADKIRILSGRPPIPVGRAIRAILARGAPEPALERH